MVPIKDESRRVSGDIIEDAYGGDLAEALNHPLRQLDEAALNAVLGDFSQWRDPTVRHGIVSRLLDAIEGYCERNG